MRKHTIWTNDLDFEDWEADLREQYPDEDEDELRWHMYDENDWNLEDERTNLNIILDRPIVVIADLGLWDGRKTGYAELNSRNIRDCLKSNYDLTTWFVDEHGDLRCDGVHHDGTNHMLYRVYKDTATEEQIEGFLNKVLEDTFTREDIEAVTDPLGDKIADVYGWKKEWVA